MKRLQRDAEMFRCGKFNGTDGCRFNEILEFEVNGKKYFMHYKEWLRLREWRKNVDPFYWL